MEKIFAVLTVEVNDINTWTNKSLAESLWGGKYLNGGLNDKIVNEMTGQSCTCTLHFDFDIHICQICKKCNVSKSNFFIIYYHFLMTKDSTNCSVKMPHYWKEHAKETQRNLNH